MELNPNLPITTEATAAKVIAKPRPLEAEVFRVGERIEHSVRLGLGWLLAIIGVIGVYGVAWDVQWHSEFGRDTFWSPPHLVIYGTVAFGGLVSLLFILLQTYRYHRGSPFVTDKNTTAFLGFFHAPLGFYMVGFGVLSTISAAPLDNYWHQLYGIDVTIWAPFHVMGLIGSLFVQFGVLMVLASEYNRSQARLRKLTTAKARRSENLFSWLSLLGLAVGMVGAMGVGLLFAVNALSPNSMVFKFGGWTPGIYSAIVALVIPLGLVAIVAGTGRVGMATLTAALFLGLRQILVATIVPLNDASGASEGLASIARSYRAFIDFGVVVANTFPITILLYGVMVDAAFAGMVWLWTRRNSIADKRAAILNFGHHSQPDAANDRSLSRWMFNPVWLIGLCIVVAVVLVLIEQPYTDLQAQINNFSNTITAWTSGFRDRLNFITYPNMLTTLPLVLLVAAVVGVLARYLGLMLRYEKK